MANKNFKQYAVAGNNITLTYDDIQDTVTFASQSDVTSVNGKDGDVVLVKADVGLGNVDNTSDANKPISTATQTALDTKASTTALNAHITDVNNPHNVTKTQIGLGNVDNTSDLNKPISTATQTALNAKQDSIGYTPANAATTLTINGVTYDLTVNRAWTVGDLVSTGSYSNPSWLTSLAWGKITSTPTTLSGYGITDGVSTSGSYSNPSWITDLAFSKITGYSVPTLAQVTTAGATTSNTLIYSGSTEFIKPNVDSVGVLGSSTNRWGNIYTRAISSVGNSLDITGININLNDNLNSTKLKVYGSTGNVVIQNGGTFTDAGFRLDVNGTARIQNQLTTTGTITAASAIARGVYFNQTLTAAANNDVLVALDIAPTFSNGAFTGVKQIGLRVNSTALFGNNTSAGIRSDYGVSVITSVNNSATNPTTSSTVTLHLENTDTTTNSYVNIAMRTDATGNAFYTNLTSQKTGAGAGIFRIHNQNVQQFAIYSGTGNVVIQNGGTFTDAGFRLDVNGTARIQNQLTTTGSITASSAIARGVYFNQTLTAAANNDILIGLQLTNTFANGAFTGVTNYSIYANNTILTTGYFYGNGIVGNNVLQISSQGTNSIQFYTNSTGVERMRIFGSTGNLLLQNGGTFTDAGYRLDVNGTARIQNVLTLGSLSADPTGANGMIYYNTTLGMFRVYQSGAWKTITAV